MATITARTCFVSTWPRIHTEMCSYRVAARIIGRVQHPQRAALAAELPHVRTAVKWATPLSKQAAPGSPTV